MDELLSPKEALAEWLQKKGATAYQLCKETALPQSRISEILWGRRRITPETATILGAFFNTGTTYWLQIQTAYDLNEAEKVGADSHICSGTLRIGGMVCLAYVLSDERRVIPARHFLAFFGIAGDVSKAGKKIADFLNSPFLRSDNIISLRAQLGKPLKFTNSKGLVDYGYEGELLVEFCHALLDLRRIKALTEHTLPYAEAAEAIVVSLSKVGIVALIDEATGYQTLRHKESLQRLFDAYFLKEYAAWAKRFPDAFYEGIFRLKNWKWSSPLWKRPPVVGKITNDIVYSRLAPGVLEELKRINPLQDHGRRKARHHQWMTPDIGHPALSQHLYAICAMMRAHTSWVPYYHAVQMSFPVQNEHLQLELSDFSAG